MHKLAVHFDGTEFKEADGVGTFKGYASTFGNLDRVGDIVNRGAFKTARAKDVLMLWQHNTEDVIGGWTAMEENDKGLAVEGELNLDVQRGREAYALLKRKHIGSMSIGYRVQPKGADWIDGIRHINKADLREISIVSIPANAKATINAVKTTEEMPSLKEFEGSLRDLGFSANEAKAIIAKGYRHVLIEKGLPREALGPDDSSMREAGDVSAQLAEIRNLIGQVGKSLTS